MLKVFQIIPFHGLAQIILKVKENSKRKCSNSSISEGLMAQAYAALDFFLIFSLKYKILL
jgi:hypothetical protein